MIQLNLLPDVKMEYLKAQRTRGLVLSSAIIITIGSIALLVLLLIVGGLQKKHINDLSKDIKADTATLQKKPNVNKILTVQNQLDSLSGLHDQKPAVANIFGYLNSLTPVQANITNFKVDFTTQTMEITGTADSLSSVNKYVDTLKFTNYTVDSENPQPAFRDVVMSSFSLSSGSQDAKQAASYTITFTYDPLIFDITKQVELVIPTTTTTTRMQPGQKAELFVSTPETNAGAGGN